MARILVPGHVWPFFCAIYYYQRTPTITVIVPPRLIERLMLLLFVPLIQLQARD